MPKLILTKREDELMNFLWEMNQPLTVEEMIEKAGDHSWNETYLRTMLRSLENKKAVECCGFVLRTKLYARQFKPAISKEEFYMQLAMDRGADEETLFHVAAAAFMKRNKDDPEEVIRKLEEMLEEYKSKVEDEE